MADPNPTPSPSVGRTSPSQAPAASRQAPSAGEFRRYRLARIVVVGSFLTIAALVFALLVIAAQNNQNATNIADKTFTTVLPVLAAWMGTVLAFYFSAQSHDRTSDSLDRMISQAASVISWSANGRSRTACVTETGSGPYTPSTPPAK